MMNTLRLLLRLSHPPQLMIGAILYFIGAGVARYLGISIDWITYVLGQVWLFLVQFVTIALNEYFELPVEQRRPSKTLLFGSSGVLELGELPRPVALWGSVASAMAAGLFTILLLQRTSGSSESLVLLLIIVLVELCYSIPPLRLSAKGYGELILSLVINALIPIFSFVLQDGSLYRIVAMISFPLSCFFLALLLIIEFPDYAADIKYGKMNLLLRLGWQGGMTLHNAMILCGFSLMLIAVILGFPWKIALPVITVVPVGFVQIWLLNRIRQGAKPNWNLMFLLASATFGLTLYFLTYGFWTH